MYGYFFKYPVADSGYGSLYNYRYTKRNGMKLFQKYGIRRFKRGGLKNVELAMNLTQLIITS